MRTTQSRLQNLIRSEACNLLSLCAACSIPIPIHACMLTIFVFERVCMYNHVFCFILVINMGLWLQVKKMVIGLDLCPFAMGSMPGLKVTNWLITPALFCSKTSAGPEFVLCYICAFTWCSFVARIIMGNNLFLVSGTCSRCLKPWWCAFSHQERARAVGHARQK